jgi:uncharacterized membrane protein YidH (DUF202 family)
MSEPDTGLPAERTLLARQRTALTGLAALLVAVRLLVEVSPLAGLVVGVFAVLTLIAPVWSAARWRRTMRVLHEPNTSDGRELILLAMLVAFAGVAAFGYVALG